MAMVQATNVKITYGGMDITKFVSDPEGFAGQVLGEQWVIPLGEPIEDESLDPIDAYVQSVLKRMEEILTGQ
jgi:hypothetical protein